MLDQKKFRSCLGHFSTGITVVTILDDKGKTLGLTANAFSSLSLEPPLILVCIDKKSESVSAFKKKNPFIVNILQENQEEACWIFASKKGTEKFNNVNYQLSEDGVPCLDDNLATIHCEVEEVFEGGDHIIVTGLVKDVSYDEEANPLLFFRGKINTLRPTNSEKAT